MNSIFWLFGRSAAGKTTLAHALQQKLLAIPHIYLDGDEMRNGLSQDLGYDEHSRWENHRRMACMAHLIAKQNHLVLLSSMAPLAAYREQINRMLDNGVYWIYVDTPLDECIRRDPKKLYQRSSSNGILSFPFDEPCVNEQVYTFNGMQINTASVNALAERIVTVYRAGNYAI